MSEGDQDNDHGEAETARRRDEALRRAPQTPPKPKTGKGEGEEPVTADDEQTDQYSGEEAQRRFEALIRAAMNTPPKPKKDIPRKRPYRPRNQKPQQSQDKKTI